MDKGHRFVKAGSFSSEPELNIAGRRFFLPDRYKGLTVESLSPYVGTPTSGLIEAGQEVVGERAENLDC
jgi:hypothetical protein